MARKRHKPEEIVAKLRQVDVLTSQGQSAPDAIRSPDHSVGADHPPFPAQSPQYIISRQTVEHWGLSIVSPPHQRP